MGSPGDCHLLPVQRRMIFTFTFRVGVSRVACRVDIQRSRERKQLVDSSRTKEKKSKREGRGRRTETGNDMAWKHRRTVLSLDSSVAVFLSYLTSLVFLVSATSSLLHSYSLISLLKGRIKILSHLLFDEVCVAASDPRLPHHRSTARTTRMNDGGLHLRFC